MQQIQEGRGWIEVVCGCMFSGKTGWLIRLVRIARIAKQKVQVFKPRLDTRYNAGQVSGHDGGRLDATVVGEAREIPELVDPDAHVVVVDEGQFFDEELPDVCDELADRGYRVIVAGLDRNFRGEGFGPMPELTARAKRVDKLQAVCVVCYQPATRTQRLIGGQPADYDEPEVVVGAEELYEARCRRCHEVPRKEEKED